MATLINQHDVQFLLLPINNNRTAWRPYGLPVLLVIPHRRGSTGLDLGNSEPWGIRVYVESVPQEARVAGQDHIGMRYPDRELYAINLSLYDIAQSQLSPESLNFVRNGQPIDAGSRSRGDYIRYTCATGVTDDIPYLPDADYFDLSHITLDVELLPSDRYNIVYEAKYYTRQLTESGTGDLLCIDITQTSLALLRRQFNHPGDVLEEFYRLTPPVYLTNERQSQDSTVAFYRPFTDIIQDISDEQDLLERVNWVHNVPYEAIPYLSALLGWDLPFFPDSLDTLRRVILRNTARLQALKGSRRALVELFRLFGLEVLITNLWWRPDGLGLIRPTPNLIPTDNTGIGVMAALQIEPLLVAYSTNGYGQFSIPLLHRPQIVGGLDNFNAMTDGGDVVVDVYLVESESPADSVLRDITYGGGNYPVGMLEGPDGFASRYGDILTIDQSGRQSDIVQRAVAGMELGGYSQLRISGTSGKVAPGHGSEFLVKGWSRPPVTRSGLGLDRDNNILSLTFNGYFNFDGSDELPPKRRAGKVYAFATYTWQKLIVPDALQHLQSNRFDIQILAIDTTPSLAGQKTYLDPTVLDFAFEFIDKIRSFHSLLNVMQITMELTETYEVTTTCVGGDVQQRWDTDFGRMQVPPAKLVVPPVAGNCTDYDPSKLGYQVPDIRLRLRKLANLPEEFNAYKLLDIRDRPETYSVTGPRIAPRSPAPGRDTCKFTHIGQDRVIGPRVERYSVEPHPGPNANYDGSRTCPARDSDRDQFDEGLATSTNYNSGDYGRFMLEGVGIQQNVCEPDGVSDYCYGGRVGDEILYRPTLPAAERLRLGTGTLSLGAGVYWTYPAQPIVWTPGTGSPGAGSNTAPLMLSGSARAGGHDGVLDNKAQAAYLTTPPDVPLPASQNSMLGKLYRRYGLPPHRSLHFSNRNQPGPYNQAYSLALRRPELGIEQATMNFPGCRSISLGKLKQPHTSPYRARPWDDQYSTSCGPIGWCHAQPGWLNARLVPGPDGEVLEYDDAPLVYAATGGDADIPDLGDHSSSPIDPNTVVHTVLSTAPAGHPAITLDRVTDAPADILETSNPLFRSAVPCTAPTQYSDFSDGYPGVTGQQGVAPDLTARNGVTFTPTSPVAIFLFGDGVLDGSMGHRLDGGCLAVDCGEPGEVLCGLDRYYTQDGDRDWGADQIWTVPGVVLDEQVGTGSLVLDGSMGNFFELVLGA